MDKDLKCHFCNKQGIAEKEIVVDIEADCELDEYGKELWYSRPVYETIWVCQKHLETEEIERED